MDFIFNPLNYQEMQEDLMKLLSTVEGKRFFTYHLYSLGLFKHIESDSDITEKSIAEELTKFLYKANKQATHDILDKIMQH